MHVEDANTLDLAVDRGRGPMLRYRLHGVATPGFDDPDPEMRRVAAHARDFVAVLVLGKDVVLRTPREWRDEHGPQSAVVYWRDPEGGWSDLGDDLVENGLAEDVTAVEVFAGVAT